jgi:type I restriction enzyme S subunit
VSNVADVPLRHVFQITSGGTPSNARSEFWDGEILWITPEDLSDLDGYWLNNTRRKITDSGYESSAATLAPPKAIVLSKRAPIGLLAVLTHPACSSQGCLLLSPKSEVDSRFYYYWLHSRVGQLQALGRGSTFTELSAADLKSIRMPIPSATEQRAIADFLDEETVQMDALVAEKERWLSLLEEKREGMITSAVLHGLDSDVPFRDSGIAWLGDIPAQWESRKIAWLFRERDQRGYPDLPLLEVSLNKGVVQRQFTGDKIESMAADFNSYKVAWRGDLVFNKMRMWQGSVGVAPVDGLVSPDYIVAEPTGSLSSAYAGFLFRVPAFGAECGRRSHGKVRDRLRLYWDGFREIEIPVPTIAEQTAVVDHVRTRTSGLDELISAANTSVALLRERRAALIAAAVTGQIDVENDA